MEGKVFSGKNSWAWASSQLEACLMAVPAPGRRGSEVGPPEPGTCGADVKRAAASTHAKLCAAAGVSDHNIHPLGDGA